ncbi:MULTISPECIES: CHAT domain-containing protein [Spirulina sp. CCY15215]|uniref:CHAT domain-containing protein n=1 Tax=Spirulina sp. CCY15215 TaxID=2767591 RepID=UPI001951E27D|nr:CHAT domain-containing protein [Spirulina major]
MNAFKLRPAAILSAILALSVNATSLTFAASFPINSQSSTKQQLTPLQEADRLFQAGIDLYRRHEFEAAIQSWQNALGRYRELQQQSREMAVLEQLGLAYKQQGELSKAIAVYQEHLNLANARQDTTARGNAWGNLANVYRLMGDYSQAISANQKALQLQRILGDRNAEGIVLSNLANVYLNIGDYERAEPLYQESLSIAKASQNEGEIARILNSLGALAATREEYDRARDYYRQSLTLSQARNFPAAEANALNNLASLYHIEKEFSLAIAKYQEFLTFARKIGDIRLIATALSGLGLAHANLEEYDRALDYYQQSRAIAGDARDTPLQSIVLGNWGHTLWKMGNLDAAEAKLKEAIALREALRTDLEDAQKVSLFDTQTTSYSWLQAVLVEQERFEEALEISERGRGRAYAEQLSLRLSGEEEIPPPTIADIRKIARDRHATLVEYSIIPDDSFIGQGKLTGKASKLFIWVIQPTGNIHFRQVDFNLASSETLAIAAQGNLDRLVRDTRAVIFSRRPQRAKVKLQEIHQILIDPIADLLPDRPDEPLIIIPHRLLFLLPFPALQDAAESYLVDRHLLIIAPAIQVLQLTQQRKIQIDRLSPQNILIAGNPTMPTIPGSPEPLPPLPGSETEAKNIAQILDTSALIGQTATESAIATQLPQAAIAHFATHGLLDEVKALGRSPGALAFTVDAETDGFLTSWEIGRLRLNADLIVLSACDTGRGEITGDGVLGLSRSFLTAGAASVAVSLWKVGDEPTAILMTEFYRQLQQDPNKAKALRQAMLKTREQYFGPSDWAAFSLIGAWE